MRDGYHRSIKKRKCKSGDGATKSKKWKYESQMEFLRPYLQERATKTNIENAESAFSDDETTNDKSVPDALAVSPEPVDSPLSSSSATSQMFKNITARKKNRTHQLSVASVLQNYLNSRPSTSTPATTESGDPIYSFFRAMADSVKALSPDLQLKAKNKIYTIVSDLEYENLLRNSTGQAKPVTKETAPPTSYDLNNQFAESVPSTSDLNKQFLKTQTTSGPQNIQIQKVPTASTTVQQNTSNTANCDYPRGMNNDSQSIHERNPSKQITYIITSDGFLQPQNVTYD